MIEARGPERRPRNFSLVQALRGIAALWVVLFHASAGGHVRDLTAALPRWLDVMLFECGHYGVSIFFALSGFVIAHSLRDAVTTPGFLGRFALRRSIRLDPPYWGAIAIVILFGWISAHVRHEPFVPPTAGRVIAHVTYLQQLLGVAPLNPAFWTLTYEVQFYLFFVAMLVIARSLLQAGFRGAMMLNWILMTLLAFVGSVGLFDRAPEGLFVHLWPDFFVGVLAYAAVERRDARIALALLIVPMLAIGPWQIDGLFARFAVLTAITLLAATRWGHAEHALNWRWLQLLGAISYSLYLLHNSLSGAVGMIAHRTFGHGVAADVITLAAILIVSIAGAALYWSVVERASHRLSRRVRLAPRELRDQLVTSLS